MHESTDVEILIQDLQEQLQSQRAQYDRLQSQLHDQAIRAVLDCLHDRERELDRTRESAAADRTRLTEQLARAQETSEQLRRELHDQKLRFLEMEAEHRQRALENDIRRLKRQLISRDVKLRKLTRPRRIAIPTHPAPTTTAALAPQSTGIRATEDTGDAYDRLVRDIHDIVRQALPPDASVLVVSRGDRALTEFERHRGGHFPQTPDGVYAGHYPPDSGAAIALLETLRDGGARYLVFPNTARWWLDYYAAFHRHLDAQCVKIWDDSRCIIYQLPGGWPRLARRLGLGRSGTEAGPLSALRRALYRPRLESLAGAIPKGTPGSWEATDFDPQFIVQRPWPSGWVQISLHIETLEDVECHPRLYMDDGRGHREDAKVDLGQTGRLQRVYAKLPPGLLGLRLDPVDALVDFTILHFSIRRVTALEAWFARQIPARRPHHSFEASRNSGGDVEAHRLATRARTTHSTSTAIDPPSGFAPSVPLDPYDAWLEVNTWNDRRAALLRERLSRISSPVLLSVVMPVYNPPVALLNRAIETVVSQVYTKWELCIADDASTDAAVRSALEGWARQDARIRVTYRSTNGHIVRATNTAVDLAGGEYLVLLDQDDELTPDALGEVACYAAEHPDADIVYSDDDKIDGEGRRYDPQFKPDWSPELLLSYMYFSHLFVIRRTLFQRVGGLRPGFEGSQDYDLALRASEEATEVGHIPKVLYHWRAIPGSTATSGHAKPDSIDAGRRAVADALARRGVRALVRQPEWAATAGCGIFSHEFPDTGPSVAILIPTKNHVELLRACVSSIEAQTTYRNHEIVIIDNDSDEPAAVEYLRQTRHRVLRISSPSSGFSFAAVNNRAASLVTADYVLFLNNDTVVKTPRWLSQMMGYVQLAGVGAVGARLLFPDGTVQHAGIVHGLYDGMVGPAFKLASADHNGYLSYAQVARNYSAATAACLLTDRTRFLALGGFDEARFSVAYNDPDFCYRLLRSGQRVVYCPTAELIHYEGRSRGFDDNPEEPANYRRLYGAWKDPYYSPHLSLDDERFRLASRTLAADVRRPIPTLMCAFSLKWEGAPYSQFELTRRLKRDGVIAPLVYCPEDGPLRSAYEAIGVKVEVSRHPLYGINTLTGYQRAVGRFADRLTEWKAELVYANTLQTFYAIEAANDAGIPSVWNPRESEPWQSYFNHFGHAIAARALKCFDYPYKVVFVADATRRGCAPLDAHGNFVTIHNALDRSRFDQELMCWPRAQARSRLKLADQDVMFLLLGTVCERKGQLDLPAAIARLSSTVLAQARFVIVGDRPGAYSDAIRAAVAALDPLAAKQISIVDETSDVAPYLSAADVFLCSSRIESYPRVILEAMASGLPIVTTPVNGIPEQVQEDRNALFYQPGDTSALASAIERLTEDRVLRAWFGRNSRLVLDTLPNFDAMTDAYAAVFREAWLTERPRVSRRPADDDRARGSVGYRVGGNLTENVVARRAANIAAHT